MPAYFEEWFGHPMKLVKMLSHSVALASTISEFQYTFTYSKPKLPFDKMGNYIYI